LLPWFVHGNATGVKAYNSDISRAVAALMPENSTNRSRLLGEHLDTALGSVLLTQVEKQAQVDDLEKQTGGTMKAIRARYTIEYARIDKFGEPGMFGAGAGEENLRLGLAGADRPSNFSDEVMLSYVNGKVVGTDKFLNDGSQFEKLALSVPWLSKYAENHPKVPITLSFVHDTSFSNAALKVFSADMTAIGRDSLIPEVEAEKDKIAVISIGSGTSHSQWLVFPDQHMLLWRFWRTAGYGDPSALPAWPESDYSAKPCADAKIFIHCVGREVSANGSLRPLQ
jgi:hypothetical protein